MEERQWISGMLREFYSKNRKSVFNIEKREFGIGDFGKKIARRHMAFVSDSELNAFLSSTPPLYISYSAAYYEFPDATPMEKKNWLGAELIFDLDSEGGEDAMKKTKEELVRLIEIMKDDFGARDYLINFSGNRGYHLHVRDKGFLDMISEDRKRIVAYVKGEGFDYRKMFTSFAKMMRDEMVNKQVIVPGPKLSDAGFAGRFARIAVGSVDADPSAVSRKLKEPANLRMFLDGIAQGEWGKGHGLDEGKLMERLGLIGEATKLGSVDADAGVTQDPTKLIRMPGSIHGSTGMEAMTLKESGIEGFDPFSDPIVFPDDKTAVMMKEDVSLRLKDISLKAKKGQAAKVPAYMAAYLCLKEKASLIS